MIKRVEIPRIVTTSADVRKAVERARGSGESVGMVPTMGALHDGHLSLVDAARRECDMVVASVFVNPTQFAPHEDYERYPRNLELDAQLLAQRGCDLVFAPSTDEMYPNGYETSIDVGSVAKPFEGKRRPTHFAGVATVVLKLLNLIPAARAYFGQKDYQQTLVVGRMVQDLNVPTKIVVCPTIREPDGLARSSRNAYLTNEERQRAPALFASLKLTEEMANDGERDVATLQTAIEEHLASIGGFEIEYVAFVRAGTVEPVTTLAGPVVALIAARLGQTRLIDNLEIG